MRGNDSSDKVSGSFNPGMPTVQVYFQYLVGHNFIFGGIKLYSFTNSEKVSSLLINISLTALVLGIVLPVRILVYQSNTGVSKMKT